MEKLHTKLFEAATQGSISSLQQLLKDDPLILDRAVVNSFNETPLHVAAMLGHVDFVKKIIGIKPQLVNELNLQQSSPLHLASAKGHVDVMKALLSVDQEACFVRDRNALTPVHIAAAKGQIEAMKLLLEVQPDAARLTVYGGENILHLCVKHYQLEALKLLLESVGKIPQFINSKDVDGNTVLHLAVADKQVEATKFLVSVGAVEVNAVNNEGMTAVDVLIRSRKDMRDSEIEKSLKQSGGFGRSETNVAAINGNQNVETQSKKSWYGEHKDWLEKQKAALMIVATLIATMAFQIGVSPPGGAWQDDLTSSDDPHEAGISILADKNPTGFGRFYIANATSLMASLSTILLLISGLPLRRRFFMWMLMATTWIAITAIGLCYVFAIALLTPNFYHGKTVWFVIGFTMIVWLLLMALLIIAHTIRLIVKLVKKLWRSFAVSAPEGNNMAV